MAQYAYLSTITDEVAAAVKAAAANAPPPPTTPPTPPQIRKTFDATILEAAKARKGVVPPDDTYKVFDEKVPVGGGEITVRCLVPAPISGEEEKFGVLVWLHGGGWSVGGVYIDDQFLRKVCVDLRVSIVNVDYRLAPEHPFPTGLNDSYAALKWAVTNSHLLSASPQTKGLILGGSSSGANVTAALTILARDDSFFSNTSPNSAKLTGQILQYPMFVHPEVVPEKYKDEYLSMEEHANAPGLTRASIDLYLGWYNPDPNSPLFSSLLAPSHKDLPPAYIQVSGLDPLRDEGILYANILKENGAKVKLDLYQGFPHGGHIWFPALDASQRFEDEFEAGLKELLAGSA